MPARLLAAPGDYNGDGLSDFAMVKVVRNPTRTLWRVDYTNGGAQQFVLRAAGRAFTHGQFGVLGVATPAVGQAASSKSQLKWLVRQANGTQSQVKLGRGKDIVAAADYDCDGQTDLAVVQQRHNLIWKIRSSKTGKTSSVLFGSPDDRVMGADIDGDGCAEMILARLVKEDINWFARKLDSRAIGQAKWGADGDIPLSPIDLNGDGKPDLVVVRTVGSKQRALINFGGGQTDRVELGGAKTVPMTGNFTGSNGFAYYNHSSGILTILDHRGRKISRKAGYPGAVVVRPDGAYFKRGADESLSGRTPATEPDPIGGKYECDAEFALEDGSGGFVHNPFSGSGRCKEVLPNRFTGDVVSMWLGKNGKIIAEYDYYKFEEYQGRDSYALAGSCSQYPDGATVIINAGGHSWCTTIPDMTVRWD